MNCQSIHTKLEQVVVIRFFTCWHRLIEIITGEFILTRYKKSNGGSVIILRSLLSAFILFIIVLFLLNSIDPGRTSDFSWVELRLQVVEKFSWFGVFFATIYAALYARFSSQWTYLANLYNQIKQAETRCEINSEKLAEWKAGFVEDAEVLHLMMKPIFSSVICEWLKDDKVRGKFDQFTPGGDNKLDYIAKMVNKVCDEEKEKSKRLCT
ncbi:MAG: hypothetical protein CVV44_02815 [Spirochaetae bacterium HGW-Spirochaetae-1]|jgi:hypothetical protein|nr:MAG: hypothetical protein CVV44_02815 [Spirochaetae bacterium HGW-Spirochaetae-1]